MHKITFCIWCSIIPTYAWSAIFFS